jgi:aryl-alcohol dehydrogenase-like predicted oxidoreductase
LEYRILGKTGLKVSLLGFGCGGVGGLMVADDYQMMICSVERAIAAGINYFDTAQSYGNGRSEENLGRVLHELKPDVVVGTKVQLTVADMDKIEARIIRAAETSLRRLQKEQLDLFQLHNPIGLQRNQKHHWVSVTDLELVIQAFQKLQKLGKIRYWGINGLGETEAIHQVVANNGTYTIQVCYNLLNPSAGYRMPENFPFQDYRELIIRAADRQMGVIAFRIIAGGALTANNYRHPIAAKSVEPIASSSEYTLDVTLARHFQFLVSEKWAENLAEAAIRFALSQPDISTIPIGLSSLDQLEKAICAVERGPLPKEVLDRLPSIWEGFFKIRKEKL